MRGIRNHAYIQRRLLLSQDARSVTSEVAVSVTVEQQ
jgi:hypothetical protein